MTDLSSNRGTKRNLSADVSASESQCKSSKVTLLSPSLLLLEIPADTNTSLPVWEAMRSQQITIAWTVNPYSISLHLTPVTSKQRKTTTPRRSERTSNVAKTTEPPIVMEPQIVIQSISQQHGASQNTSCVLLTFPQHTSQALPSSPYQKVPPNPANSFIVSLPLIITQPPPAPQPCTPVIKGVLPAMKNPPKAATIKPQVAAKPPVASLFHTKSSSDTQICDNFLLSLCHAGKTCKMHHTPYPFHWQLWCVINHQWVDISPRSQVILERIYCDVDQEAISIKDGNAHYRLIFDSMELDDPSKYDGVRRLTNSDSLISNPYFPSKWQIYWWNFGWEEYDKDTSALLLKKMSEKEPECSFRIGQQEYKVDFTMMTQTNVTTGFQRAVRCRPVYRSPDSMQPYLKTVIHTDPSQAVSDLFGSDFSVDPLEEFCSWYPPVWCLASEQDYSLVDVPAGTQAYRSVQNLFYESLSETKTDIIGIQQVQNLLHWDKYQRHKAYMQKHTKSKEPLERHLFHGTTKEASEEICHNNFDPRMAGINGASFGYGSYFAKSASLSNDYSAMVGPGEVRCMFLAKVLVGKVSLGRKNYRRPPPLSSKTKQYRLYDTCVDIMDKPTMFVVFDSCQCYPYYLIKYRDLPKEIVI
ncbi:protein mono-ADP-ribosyltransferase TIPARP-like [Thunnus albacares]|uniref:protein mono-ADP-ribosyltransferase TIPARP-like n=1 Tax=Thunnus albacares TaxID=8236 RepID=UPI001CF69000|nr:protein mono-ADP-ribosyltransferase TIPARP-like [Thunnus albacares]XP_044199386.1 protein mono-ADP-ribosyltransferase TIPARP-like [Thunnus albacares]